jgi:hypothetical protein
MSRQAGALSCPVDANQADHAIDPAWQHAHPGRLQSLEHGICQNLASKRLHDSLIH